MKKRFLFSGLAAALILLSGCAETHQPTENGGTVTMDNQTPLTLEYVLENTDLTAKDFEGVDFQAFVAHYALTTENLHAYHLPDLIEMFQAKQNDTFVSYIDLYQNANGTLTEADFDNLQTLVWEYHGGSKNLYMVIDFADGSVYSSQSNIIEQCRESDKVADLTDEDKQFIETCLVESGITAWKNEYLGTDEGTTGSLSWGLAVQLTDGRCIAYHGEGVQNSGTPSEFYTMTNDLLNHFTETK